jgi:hypothetical protein
VGRIGCKRFSAVFEKDILPLLNGFGGRSGMKRSLLLVDHIKDYTYYPLYTLW